MYFLPFLHFFSFVVYLCLATAMLVKNHKSPLHRTIFAFLVCFCIWSFGEIFTSNSAVSKDVVALFVSIGSFGWCSFGSFFLWFSVIFTKKEKILKNKLFYIFIFIFPAVFIYKQWTNSLIVDHIKKSYGWSTVWASSVWSSLFFLYYLSFAAIGICLIFSFGKKSDNLIKKKQSGIIFITTIAALLFGTVTNVILPKAGIYELPNLGDVAMLIWAVGLVYSIIKYEFLVTPATAAEAIISTMTDSLALLDSGGNIIAVNKAILSLLGYGKEDLRGKPVNILFADEKSGMYLMKKSMDRESVSSWEAALRSKTGKAIPIIFSSSVLNDESGNMAGIVCVAHDITERKRMEGKLQILADEDGLTGLKNRRVFYDQLQKECRRSVRYGCPLSLLFIDIDDFKSYNDSYGHNEGDIVLVRLADVLRKNTRISDIPFRLGGEEFVVLLTETNIKTAFISAERIRKLFGLMEFFVKSAENPEICANKTISIGIAEYHADITPESFVQMADKAMYAAKKEGKNRTCIFKQESKKTG